MFGLSIFTKQIHQITYEDIHELLVEGVEENIRLEFKRDYPGKSNLLKKLSAFANTYGGYLILGVEEDGKGKIKSLPGIPKINRLDQTIVQWCFEEIYPPIIPSVSPPIPHPKRKDRYFYVIYIEQSQQTPHILNKSRKGLYVRTDEYSQKFLTRLAKFDELEFLINKRKKAEELSNSLIHRARLRLSTHKRIKYQEHHGTDALLHLCLIPLFPQNRMFGPEKLIPFAKESVIKARGGNFPDLCDEKLHSQFESIISENPGIGYYSYFEINIYNMLFYVCDITREYKTDHTTMHVIPLKVLMAEIILFLEYAKKFYSKSGFNGMLKFIIRLENIYRQKIRVEGEKIQKSRISYIDNQMEMDRTFSIMKLSRHKEIALDVFKELCFSLGYKKIYELPEERIDRFFKDGLNYLGWEK